MHSANGTSLSWSTCAVDSAVCWWLGALLFFLLLVFCLFVCCFFLTAGFFPLLLLFVLVVHNNRVEQFLLLLSFNFQLSPNPNPLITEHKSCCFCLLFVFALMLLPLIVDSVWKKKPTLKSCRVGPVKLCASYISELWFSVLWCV